MTASLHWTKQKENDGTVLVLSGRVDEHADFMPILSEITGEITLDLGGIERINSSGVMLWGRFMREVANRAQQLRFVRCSPVVVSQLNMIQDFAAGAQVDSFFAPYLCEDCGVESDRLLVVAQHRDELEHHRVPLERCPECGSEMVLNSLEESYLGFLKGEAS